MIVSDFLVIGGGIAGLSFALKVAEIGTVNLIIKDDFSHSSTQLAQGGISTVLDKHDSFEAHIEDTMSCGYGICHRDIVEKVISKGPEAIEELAKIGVAFTKTGDDLALHREGGHSHNRIIHAKDATGAEIMRAMVANVKKHHNIKIYSGYTAVDLIIDQPIGQKKINDKSRAIGAYILEESTEEIIPMLASVTYLATGGLGKVYPYTSNPKTATGDGIVMGHRIGLEIVNLEFIQFHPTVLFHSKSDSFLITEAVRGEGAILRDHEGRAFMAEYHPELKDLAPRDVVARAIDNEIKKTGHEFVRLDITHLPAEHIINHFPTIYEKLLNLGIDMTKEPIPVVPAAHYSCGGLDVDKYGQTGCKGLFAGGECCHTGLHGANRLASNSLLEAAVFAGESYQYILENKDELLIPPTTNVAKWESSHYTNEEQEILVHSLWKELRIFMWDYVGIVRSDIRLKRAKRRIEFMRQEIEESYQNFKITRELVELRNIAVIADLIISSAIKRKESRGLHYNMDHPESISEFEQDTVIQSQVCALFM